MNHRHCLIVTKQEVQAGLKVLYGDMISDLAKDIVAGNSHPIPPLVLAHGIDKLNTDELVSVAELWADLTLDAYNQKHKGNTAIVVLMFNPDASGTNETGSTYVLNPRSVFKKDLEYNPLHNDFV